MIGTVDYTGSVINEQLIEQGHKVVAFDKLQHGYRVAVYLDAEFIKGGLLDTERFKLFCIVGR